MFLFNIIWINTSIRILNISLSKRTWIRKKKKISFICICNRIWTNKWLILELSYKCANLIFILLSLCKYTLMCIICNICQIISIKYHCSRLTISRIFCLNIWKNFYNLSIRRNNKKWLLMILNWWKYRSGIFKYCLYFLICKIYIFH